MAKLGSGILGPMTGKVAGVVGGQWKGVHYIRSYVKPANPDTDKQKAKRKRFGDTAAFCTLFIGQILNVFMQPFLRGMSAFNWMVQQNIAQFETLPADLSKIILSHGPLTIPTVSLAVVFTNKVTVTFSPSLGANGKDDDNVMACCYDPSSGVAYFATDPVARSTGTIDIPWTGVSSITGVGIWCLAGQNDVYGNISKVSNSSAYVGP